MPPRVTHVECAGVYRLRLTFNDGISGIVDLWDDVVGRGGVFAPLQNPAYFRRVSVDPGTGSIVWPNGVDLDPDVLYHRLTSRPLPPRTG